MKICLLGEYSYRQWCGSATFKVQMNMLRELSSKTSTILCELCTSGSRRKKLFSRLRIIRIREGLILSGGFLPLLFFLLSHRFRIIHLMVIRNYMLPLVPLLFLFRKKTVVTLHDTLCFREKERPAYRIILRILLPLFSCVFVCSRSDLALISRFIPPRRIKLIRHGTDLPSGTPEESSISGNIITYAGGNAKKCKGLSVLSAVIPHLRHKGVFHICGEGIQEHLPSGYLGELDKGAFRKQLQASRIIVIPSLYESFSLTALEAMAAGIPVIISTGCGVSGYFTDGYDCLKVPPVMPALNHSNRSFSKVTKSFERI